MAEAISNTSPVLYLHRIGKLGWLYELFSEVWIPPAVIEELREGSRRGYDVPDLERLEWIRVVASRSFGQEGGADSGDSTSSGALGRIRDVDL